MSQYLFSGHESFPCKLHWLKKGYDFLKNDFKFSDASSLVELGVGKNMVSSINFWMQAFGLVDPISKHLTFFANYIFDDNGKDPYLEDDATIWLLHYYLIKTQKASLYSLVFNEFRKERIEFTKDLLIKFIERKCIENNFNFNRKTVDRDISVFFKNYIKQSELKNNLDDNYNCLFADLNLIEYINDSNLNSIVYKIENKKREQIPYQIILFVIIDSIENEYSISFEKLHTGFNNVGNIFALNLEGLNIKIDEILCNYKKISFKDNSGIKELQIKESISKYEVLNNYYEI